LVVVLLLGGLLTGCSRGNSSSSGGVPANQKQAETAVASVDGSLVELAFIGEEAYLAGNVERFSSSPSSSAAPIEYYYDPAADRIVRRDDFSPVAGDIRLTLDEARLAAETFAREKLSTLDPASLELLSETDAASNSAAPGIFAFYWSRTDAGSGALLPTFLTIEVDGASGAVRSFNSADVPVTVGTTPKIAKESALAIAREATGATAAAAGEEADLVVAVDPEGNSPGRQVLVWMVTISARTPEGFLVGVQALIDAQTGKVVRVDALQ
jgi:hypothetical protein